MLILPLASQADQALHHVLRPLGHLTCADRGWAGDRSGKGKGSARGTRPGGLEGSSEVQTGSSRALSSNHEFMRSSKPFPRHLKGEGDQTRSWTLGSGLRAFPGAITKAQDQIPSALCPLPSSGSPRQWEWQPGETFILPPSRIPYLLSELVRCSAGSAGPIEPSRSDRARGAWLHMGPHLRPSKMFSLRPTSCWRPFPAHEAWMRPRPGVP